jgi:hypothetical protein
MCNHEDYPCCGCDGPLTQHEYDLQQESAREQEEAELWDTIPDEDDDDEYDEDYDGDVDLQQEMHDVSQAMGGPDEDFGVFDGRDDWGDGW